MLATECSAFLITYVRYQRDGIEEKAFAAGRRMAQFLFFLARAWAPCLDKEDLLKRSSEKPGLYLQVS